MAPHEIFIITAPGLESAGAAELAALPAELGATWEQVPGGLQLRGGLEALAWANLHLRCASRVLLRVGTLRARGASELERKAAQLPWEGFVPPGARLEVHASSRRSRLYHTGLLAQILENAVAARLNGALQPQGAPPGPDEAAPVRLQLRMEHDHATLSVDSSGELLHRRGYRLAGSRAPLRETLAAGLLHFAGWGRGQTLLDPFCGAGTLPIEAALWAADCAPGSRRSFACESWPLSSAALWARLRAAAEDAAQRGRAAAAAAGVRIVGRDLDEEALRRAQENATRAGVADLLRFERADARQAAPPPGPAGLLLANLPYGKRVGRGSPMEPQFRALGEHLRRHFVGWRLGLLLPEGAARRALGLRWEQVEPLDNGGLRVLFSLARMDSGEGASERVLRA